MKNLTHVSLLGLTLGAALALSACGGDSDSSGAPHQTSSYTKTIANGNIYSCPSKPAVDQCLNDSSCAAAKCDLIKVVTPPAPDTTCKSVGNTVYATAKGCSYSNASMNSGAVQTYKCVGGKVTNGSITATNINLNGIIITCEK
ncbi:MAG: hypothetical protein Q4P13_04120 [Psychrobacter sp.]|nr:hypothetical protein [Psychrobacter sp.]